MIIIHIKYKRLYAPLLYHKQLLKFTCINKYIYGSLSDSFCSKQVKLVLLAVNLANQTDKQKTFQWSFAEGKYAGFFHLTHKSLWIQFHRYYHGSSERLRVSLMTHWENYLAMTRFIHFTYFHVNTYFLGKNELSLVSLLLNQDVFSAFFFKLSYISIRRLTCDSTAYFYLLKNREIKKYRKLAFVLRAFFSKYEYLNSFSKILQN